VILTDISGTKRRHFGKIKWKMKDEKYQGHV
jgi:hypothetical protein